VNIAVAITPPLGIHMNMINFIKENLLKFLRKKEEVTFKSAGVLTLGVEIELQLIDPQNLNLTSKADVILSEGSEIKKLKPEFYMSTVEINTDKCYDVHDVEKDLTESFNRLEEVGKRSNVAFATTGCHPFSRYSDCVITPSPRYNELIDRNQWLTRRMTVYGLHVHIGMKSGDDCIKFNNFFMSFTPHLLALSASSPFWQGDDTGLASCRPTTYEAMPTAGQPYRTQNWQEFENLYHTLKKCNAIQTLRDLWWDMRPSPNYGTLEIRVCDGPATLSEAVAITAYIHLLAHWFNDNANWIDQFPSPLRWLSRENKWRAMRHGLEADIILNAEGKTRPIKKEIEDWLVKTSPYASKLGYEKYVAMLKEILRNGNSSSRQRAVFSKTGSLQAVVQHNINEFSKRAPIWEEKVEAIKPEESFNMDILSVKELAQAKV
jgi:carboxylate-amine ligase